MQLLRLAAWSVSAPFWGLELDIRLHVGFGISELGAAVFRTPNSTGVDREVFGSSLSSWLPLQSSKCFKLTNLQRRTGRPMRELQ
jgi:hypothetical protein